MLSARPLRVLCLDIEGGYGGSSRSLYYLLKYVDRDRVSPEVWCKREGPIQPMYESLGIPVQVEPRLPKVSSLPRLSRSAYAHLRFVPEFLASNSMRARLVSEINSRFDIVHFNHEALYLLAWWLRGRTEATFAMHNRTYFGTTWFARRQARRLVRDSDVNIFITEREREDVRQLSGWTGGVVIHNVVEPPAADLTPHALIPLDRRFTVACLANYDWLRGIDRLVDVAVQLRDAGRSDIRFVVAGKLDLAGRLPGLLGEIAVRGGTLSDYAMARGVGHMFQFLGHVSNPERVLAASNVLAKPSREDNPWGRDILEALSMGRPVFACGTYEKFVKPGVSGFLYPHHEGFSAEAMAGDILRLADNPQQLKAMGIAARERVREACDGHLCAADLMSVWEQAHRRRKGQLD